MACSHASGCPLFPKLNASLSGWRDAYCDSDSGWKSCARYTQSLTGQAVPITLLPNGKYAHTVTRSGVGAQAPQQRSRFESLPRVGAIRPGTPFEDAPAPVRAPAASSPWDALPSPVLVRTPTPAPTPAPRQARTPPNPATPARERWWTRLVNWMRGPA
jgi:hypothetical protein